MKKILLAAGILVVLTACHKDEGIISDTATAFSFTVTIPQGEVLTRTVTDAFGTRCCRRPYDQGRRNALRLVRTIKPI